MVVANFEGHLLEGYAHNRLQRGGAFEIRDLDTVDAKPTELVLPAMTEVVFHALDDIKARVNQPLSHRKNLQPTQYARPVPNFESINSLISPDKFFQMTVSNLHPIKSHGLKGRAY